SAAPQFGQAKRLPEGKSISISSRRASGSKSLRLTVHGGVRANASCSRVVSRMIDPPHAARPARAWRRARRRQGRCAPLRGGPGEEAGAIPRVRLRRPEGRLLTTPARGTWGVVRPGRRNGPCQPNQETRSRGQHRLAKQGEDVSTHSQQRGSRIRKPSYFRPYNLVGGQAILSQTIPLNSFAINLASVLKRYFSSEAVIDNDEILTRGYVSSKDTTKYDGLLETFLRD